MRSIAFAIFTKFSALALAIPDEVAPQEYPEEYSTYDDDMCIEELDLKFENGSININSPNRKCYQHCVFLKREYINDSGEPILDSFPGRFKSMASDCNEKTENTEEKCERVNSFNTCYEREKDSFFGKVGAECEVYISDIKEDETEGLKQVNCYYECILKKEGFINENNEIDANNYMKMYIGEKNFDIIEIIKKCQEQNGQSGKCGEVMKIWDCIPVEIYNQRSNELDA